MSTTARSCFGERDLLGLARRRRDLDELDLDARFRLGEEQTGDEEGSIHDGSSVFRRRTGLRSCPVLDRSGVLSYVPYLTRARPSAATAKMIGYSFSKYHSFAK